MHHLFTKKLKKNHKNAIKKSTILRQKNSRVGEKVEKKIK